MDSIWEVINSVTSLRIQGPNKSTTKNMREDRLKGEAMMPSSRYCASCLRNWLVSLFFLGFVPLAIGPCPRLFLIGLHKSSIPHSRRGRVLPFQLSVGLALSYSVKPPQSASLVGLVMKSRARIPIRDRGQGWLWKSIDISTAKSSSLCHALTSQLPECGWSKTEGSSGLCHALTGQHLQWLEQGSRFIMGEDHCLWNWTLRGFLGPSTAFQVSLSQEVTAFLTVMWWIQGIMPITFNSSRGCQDDRARACPNWLKLFLFSVFNPYLISRRIGMNPIFQRNGCPFGGFSGNMVGLEVSGHLQFC